MKNMRYKLNKEKKVPVVPVESLDNLQRFLDQTPEGAPCMWLRDQCGLERRAGSHTVPFCLAGSQKTNEILQDSALPAFLMDVTFQGNRENLVAGSCGPVGLHVSETQGPSMRFFPVMMMISTSENKFAQQLLMNLGFERCHDLGLEVDTGYFDCSCFHPVEKACKQNGLGITVRRCLQHVACPFKTWVELV